MGVTLLPVLMTGIKLTVLFEIELWRRCQKLAPRLIVSCRLCSRASHRIARTHRNQDRHIQVFPWLVIVTIGAEGYVLFHLSLVGSCLLIPMILISRMGLGGIGALIVASEEGIAGLIGNFAMIASAATNLRKMVESSVTGSSSVSACGKPFR